MMTQRMRLLSTLMIGISCGSAFGQPVPLPGGSAGSVAHVGATTSNLPSYLCVNTNCAGAVFINGQGTGQDGCFWNGQTGGSGKCVGKCQFCSGDDSATALVCEPSDHGSCVEGGGGGDVTCGNIWEVRCFYAVMPEFPKVQCDCDPGEGGDDTGYVCHVANCS